MTESPSQPESFDYDVFISHASADKALVQRIAERTQFEGNTFLFRDPKSAMRRVAWPSAAPPCGIPEALRQFAYVDWRTPSDEAYDKLRTACRGDEAETPQPPTRKKRAHEKAA